jgi:uncharacterized membrane protein
MRQEYPIEQSDAVIAVRGDNGAMKLNRLFCPVAGGNSSEVPWEALIGVLLLAPLSGSARGALRALGLGDHFITRAARTLRSGNASFLLLIRGAEADKVRATLRRVGGPVLRGAFDETKAGTLPGVLAGIPRSSGKNAG